VVTVERHLDPEDYRAFAAFVARSAGGPNPVLIGAVAGGLLAAAYVTFAVLDRAFDPLTAIVTAGVLFAWLVVRAWARSRVIIPEADGLLVEPSTLTVDDAGLADRGARAESVFRWPAVRRVAVTEGHVFVMFDAVDGLIVPVRCFEDEAAEDAFLAELRRHLPPEVPFTDERSK
jgi:YcxB-like protein